MIEVLQQLIASAEIRQFKNVCIRCLVIKGKVLFSIIIKVTVYRVDSSQEAGIFLSATMSRLYGPLKHEADCSYLKWLLQLLTIRYDV